MCPSVGRRQLLGGLIAAAYAKPSLAQPLPALRSVVDFGARGDGELDCTKELQAAVDSGENVYVPAGVFRIDGTVTMGKSAGNLFGASRRAELLKTGEGPLLRIGSDKDSGRLDSIAVRDLSFRARTKERCTAIEVIGTKQSSIQNVQLANLRITEFRSTPEAAKSITDVHGFDPNSKDPEQQWARLARSLPAFLNCSAIVFHEQTWANSLTGIYIDRCDVGVMIDGRPTDYIKLSGCTIIRCKIGVLARNTNNLAIRDSVIEFNESGVTLRGCTHSTFDGCQFEGNCLHHIAISSSEVAPRSRATSIRSSNFTAAGGQIEKQFCDIVIEHSDLCILDECFFRSSFPRNDAAKGWNLIIGSDAFRTAVVAPLEVRDDGIRVSGDSRLLSKMRRSGNGFTPAPRT